MFTYNFQINSSAKIIKYQMSQLNKSRRKKIKASEVKRITYSVCYFLLQKWFYDGKNAFKYSGFIDYMDCFYPNGEAILWAEGKGGLEHLQYLKVSLLQPASPLNSHIHPGISLA